MVKWPSDTLLAYLAGLVDGEGYVGAKRRMPTVANKMSAPKYSVAFSIAMTDRAPIQLVADFCGASGAIRTRVRKAHYKPIHEFELENDRAANFLRKIQPYVVAHSEQIRLALLLHDLRKQSRNHRTKVLSTHTWKAGPAIGFFYSSKGLSDEFISRCDEFYSILKVISPRSGQGKFFMKAATR